MASANILGSLGPTQAREALEEVLALRPDLIGLQEWGPARFALLRESGRPGLVPHLGGRLSRRNGVGAGYLWNMPLVGGCVVGARADRFELVQCRTRFLSRLGLADRHQRRPNLEPARAATVAVYRDRHLDQTVCLVDYHLVAGVQRDGRYRADLPALVARHRREVRALDRLVREQLDRGHLVFAAGDSNFDGLRLEGLTSAWAGVANHPGTFGRRRKIDDVHGPGPAENITLVTTPSDHKAVVVRR